jgi:hypothetical protein
MVEGGIMKPTGLARCLCNCGLLVSGVRPVCHQAGGARGAPGRSLGAGPGMLTPGSALLTSQYPLGGVKKLSARRIDRYAAKRIFKRPRLKQDF